MHIGIDYTAAVRQMGGIGRYTRNLVRSLARLDSQNRYTLFVAGGRRGSEDPGRWPANFRLRRVPISDRWLHILWQRLRLPVPIQLVTGHVDLFHSPDFVLPPLGGTSAILTVHDLSFLRVPECFVPGFRQYLEKAVSRAIHRAQRVLADSESTRQDLIDLMSVEPERVNVLYPGVESRFRPIQDAETLDRVRTRYRLPAKFILGLGTLQPRKNFEGLIEAFRRLLTAETEGKDHPPARDLCLVIVGNKGWMYEGILALPEQLGLSARVHIPGFVDDKDLPAIYNLASVFAFPSRYEGFGLPILEAMACGTPVVAANNSSLPEVVGEAGLLVDSGDVGALADALACVLQDEILRRRLVAAGRRQAQRFTWERAATHLLRIYRGEGHLPLPG
jgi:glycosyltransferase involved in cell wall biosynthesis